MKSESLAEVAIVDYGLGNLYSVRQACEAVGLSAKITSSKNEILKAAAVILPGVGAFGDAMSALRRLDLVTPLRDLGSEGKPLLGICLGLQLLMSESYEFGRHEGLDIIRGSVVRFDGPMGPHGRLRVPQVGWNRIYPPRAPGAEGTESCQCPWTGTVFNSISAGTYMYFVHSFYAVPEDDGVVFSFSKYGHIEFCSSLKQGNVLATQFHPERSGPRGLSIYLNLAAQIDRKC